MGKKNSNGWVGLLFMIGGLWLLSRVTRSPKVGWLAGIPDAERELLPYIHNDGTEVFNNDLRRVSKDVAGRVIRTIIRARRARALTEPIYKPFPGSRYITGEFRSEGIRILCFRLADDNFLMASFFEKGSDKTPKHEIEKAESRIKEYISRS